MTRDEYVAILERERFSTAYLEHDHRRKAIQRLQDARREREMAAAVEETKEEQKPSVTPQEKRIRTLYFQAGRYAAGARDERAIQAYRILKEKLGDRRVADD